MRHEAVSARVSRVSSRTETVRRFRVPDEVMAPERSEWVVARGRLFVVDKQGGERLPAGVVDQVMSASYLLDRRRLDGKVPIREDALPDSIRKALHGMEQSEQKRNP